MEEEGGGEGGGEEGGGHDDTIANGFHETKSVVGGRDQTKQNVQKEKADSLAGKHCAGQTILTKLFFPDNSFLPYYIFSRQLLYFPTTLLYFFLATIPVFVSGQLLLFPDNYYCFLTTLVS